MMHEREFELIAEKLHELHFQKEKTKYIQILKEWNETKGFNDIEETPSVIEDIEDTVDALSHVESGIGEEYGEIGEQDINSLKNFLNKNKLTTIMIRKA